MVESDSIASNEWDSLCEWLDDMGILAKADRSLMIHYVTTYSEWRKYFVHVRDHGVSVPTANGAVTTSPEAHQYNKLSDRLLKLLVELGLTPSARSRLKAADKSDEDDPFASLVGRLSGLN
jgi:P27 family predicted phage terminase small subunit